MEKASSLSSAAQVRGFLKPLNWDIFSSHLGHTPRNLTAFCLMCLDELTHGSTAQTVYVARMMQRHIIAEP